MTKSVGLKYFARLTNGLKSIKGEKHFLGFIGIATSLRLFIYDLAFQSLITLTLLLTYTFNCHFIIKLMVTL